MNHILFIIIILFILLIFKNKKKYIIEKLSNTNFINNYKYVCLYAYYEKNEKYKNNLQFFINNGILDDIMYYIIINNFKCSVSIPNKKNIVVIYRENTGYDFGAWSYCIENYIKTKYFCYWSYN